MRAWLVAATIPVLAACGVVSRNPVPESAQIYAIPAAPPAVRVWGDENSPAFLALARERIAQRRALGLAASAPTRFLAISGGGSDGAFGAGLLIGWSAAGTRPAFDIVTGISTGALTAPFAFLGSAYDAQLRAVYTTYGGADIARLRGPLTALGSDALADSTPLQNLIEHYVTADMLSAVAAEHKKGRRLLIGTTHLDAQRPVIWNMGALAERGDARSLTLFRKVVLASASVPGVFPPVLIEVERDGRIYDEMHVDGGVANQAFMFPLHFDGRSLDARATAAVPRRLFVIRNARLSPHWDAVEPRLVPIAGRSISTLIKYQGHGDLTRIYLQARSVNADFNLASIPESFTETEAQPFDADYMRALFELGYQMGRAGYRWSKRPPQLAAAGR
ncbi:MAG: patatin-like phospholipase family protein [Hyphomicrobiales bacterium]|nr:patatin-like phospholipase family protein [Hyphomicrobiales bacterium]